MRDVFFEVKFLKILTKVEKEQQYKRRSQTGMKLMKPRVIQNLYWGVGHNQVKLGETESC